MHSIKQTDHAAHKPVAQTGLGRHCPTFCTLANARADNKVRASAANGSQDYGQVSGIITPISIHKYGYLSANAIRYFETLQTGSSITRYGFAGDDCSSSLSYIRRSIDTAIINHNHPLCDVLGKLCK